MDTVLVRQQSHHALAECYHYRTHSLFSTPSQQSNPPDNDKNAHGSLEISNGMMIIPRGHYYTAFFQTCQVTDGVIDRAQDAGQGKGSQ